MMKFLKKIALVLCIQALFLPAPYAAEKASGARAKNTIPENMRLYADDVRANYGSDEIFANFREVRAGSIGRGTLYRSSIPCSLTRARAPYADALARQAGIKTVLNLANAPERLAKVMNSKECPSPYYRSLYRSGTVIARRLPAMLSKPEFRSGLAEELRFLGAHDGPYLVHCAEGKDRTGFVCFLLGALMGASPKELERDYGITYLNYYHLRLGEPRYTFYVGEGLSAFYYVLGGSAADGEKLPALAEKYLLGIGLTEDEIAAVKKKLSQSWQPRSGKTDEAVAAASD
jgi:protein tyrosine/serine phosphatase